MRLQRTDLPGVPAALFIIASFCLWWLGSLVGEFSAQIASLYELQATLKRDAMVTVFEGE